MEQIEEIRETARIAKSFLSDNRPPYAILIALEDIPRLCDALERARTLIDDLVDDEYREFARQEIRQILEGKKLTKQCEYRPEINCLEGEDCSGCLHREGGK